MHNLITAEIIDGGKKISYSIPYYPSWPKIARSQTLRGEFNKINNNWVFDNDPELLRKIRDKLRKVFGYDDQSISTDYVDVRVTFLFDAKSERDKPFYLLGRQLTRYHLLDSYHVEGRWNPDIGGIADETEGLYTYQNNNYKEITICSGTIIELDYIGKGIFEYLKQDDGGKYIYKKNGVYVNIEIISNSIEEDIDVLKEDISLLEKQLHEKRERLAKMVKSTE